MKKVLLKQDLGKWKKGYVLAFPDSVAAQMEDAGTGCIVPDDTGLKKTGSENYVNCTPMSKRKLAAKAAARAARLDAEKQIEQTLPAEEEAEHPNE